MSNPIKVKSHTICGPKSYKIVKKIFSSLGARSQNLICQILSLKTITFYIKE